jgi:dethiobiotin synthetase
MIRFVTGTDTGVGKTVAAAVLAARAGSDGVRVRYVKTIQTGLAPGAPGDADFVSAASGVEAVELLRFAEPLAPAVAAAREGRSVDVAGLVEAVRALARDVDLLLVEGAGGLLVPLSETETMADLALALGAELVVVARAGLGTLNHTALTLEVARGRGLSVAGLVVSRWPRRPGVADVTNLERLRAMAPLLAVVPVVRGLSVDGARPDALARALASRPRAFAGSTRPG